MELDLLSPEGFDDESLIGNDKGAPTQESGLFENEQVTPITLEPGQTLKGTGLQILHPRDIPYSDVVTISRFGIHLPESMPPELRKAFNDLHSTLPHVSLTARDITRWKMAWRAYRPRARGKPENAHMLSGASHQQLLARRCRDWPESHGIFQLPIILGFTAATFVYGGLHALAWSAHFDSAIEKLLWRISSCVVMGGLPVILGLAGWDHYQELIGRAIIGYYRLALQYTLILMFVAYVLARAYLVVECFINVFHLPAGVFDTPEWSTYFPHVS